MTTVNVSDFRANPNENIRHAAQTIGRSKNRRAVFEAIYHGKKAVKTIPEITKRTELSHKQVLIQGKQLAANQIVEQVSVDGRVAYKKDATLAHHKRKILDLLDHPQKKARYPTKQEPRVSGTTVTYQVGVPRSNPQPQEVTVDDIDAFAAVRGAGPGTIDLSKTRESDVKRFLSRLVGEMNEFTDWGGEKNDIYTSRLRFRGKRRTAAFAIKGRATKSTLTPNKMGTNGDQVARLFASEASVFFVVYHGKVDQSIHEQMRAYGIARALAGIRVYYCVIDGNDLSRLAAAYPDEFAASVTS
jgi:hypothetical protein